MNRVRLDELFGTDDFFQRTTVCTVTYLNQPTNWYLPAYGIPDYLMAAAYPTLILY